LDLLFLIQLRSFSYLLSYHVDLIGGVAILLEASELHSLLNAEVDIRLESLEERVQLVVVSAHEKKLGFILEL
jgi:hypothetical protein